MATALWVRTIKHHRMDLQNVQPCTRDDPQEALQDACHALDLPKPLWLPKNQREWEEFGQTRFLPDAFMEHVDFDRLEIEYIDPDAKKRRSRDPRNGGGGAFCPPVQSGRSCRAFRQDLIFSPPPLRSCGGWFVCIGEGW